MSTVQDWSRHRRPRDYSLPTGILLAATGLVVWTGISVWGGLGSQDAFTLREAWETNAYFSLGLPLLSLAVGVAAFYMPERIWRWPLWVVAGHQAGVLVVGIGMQSGASLVLLTLIVAILLAAIFSVPALVGSALGRRAVERV